MKKFIISHNILPSQTKRYSTFSCLATRKYHCNQQ